MRSFAEIIEYLKKYLAQNTRTKVLDKDVAKALKIAQTSFATMKRRNSIPYAQVLEFCYKEKLSCCKVFFYEESFVQSPTLPVALS